MSTGYKTKFISAYHKTKELGLHIEGKPIPIGKALPDKKIKNICEITLGMLRSSELKNSYDLAEKCIPVHMSLKEVLKKHLNVNAHVTIGDRYWDDFIYCEMTYDSIVKEIESPSFDSPLRAHVWLTLSDGTILDCTGEAHSDLLFERGIYPSEQCISLIRPDKRIQQGYHRPFLIGSEFLTKTGSYRVISS